MSDRIKPFGVLLGAVLLLLPVLPGCSSEENVIQGISLPAKVDPSTAEFHYEFEMIPNAELVKEDTTPIWPLGRYAFRSGPDRLLVVTRITTLDEKLTDEQKKQGVKPERYERFFERAWITIPAGTELNEELDLQKLQEQFLVGYDEQEGAGYFVQPNRITGKVRILEERPDVAVVKINMAVQPSRKTPWWVKETLAVPITPTGVRASLVLEDNRKPRETPPATPQQPEQSPTTQAVAPPPPGMATLPLQPGEEYDPQPTAEESVQRFVGSWEGTMRPTNRDSGRPDQLIYTYRFQFGKNKNFVFTTQRPGFPEFSRWGEWDVKDDYLILHVLKFGRHVDHLKFLKSPFVSLQLKWKDNRPILKGDVGAAGGIIDLHLTQGTFPRKEYLDELN